MITTEHRVSVQIPDDVWEKFGGTMQYQHMVSAAITGYIEAGRDAYSDVYEWATFSDMDTARQCELRLFQLVSHFKAMKGK